MKKVVGFALALLLVAVGCPGGTKTPPKGPGGATAAEEPRPDNPAERWNLADVYPTDQAWKEALAKFEARLPELDAIAGTLGKDAASMAAGLELRYEIEKELYRLYSYGMLRSDADTRNAEALEMKQKAALIETAFEEKTSFIQPEILAIGKEKVAAFLAAEPRLKVFAHFLDSTLRLAPHTLDAKSEHILAATGMISEGPATLYRIFTGSDLPWPTITLSDGKEVRLDMSAYTLHRASPNRADREKVFTAFWGKWKEFEQTMGVALYAKLRKDLFYAQTRKYPTCLARSLDRHHIPEAVYHMLIESANQNLPTLHRFLRLRGRMLGIEDLRYHDIYPPLVATDKRFPIEVGKELTLAALARMGEEYVATVRKGFENRWMDTYPREGKRPGAYSLGAAYDVHPYVLMNYNDDYESVSTLAHEWGHAMHSYLASKAQPFATSSYAIFTAEVASTFNEGLLLDHVLKTAETDDDKLYYLGTALGNLRGTFFRQAMFAEFELRIHELVEKGQALSGKRVSELYLGILRKYHGHDAGVMNIEEAYAIEWAYVHHFYRDYYVYKYATSVSAASLLVEEVLQGKEGALERYLDLLKAGGNGYPYELLAKAGVDMATPNPYGALVKRMNRIMDEMEAILDRK